ncbi:MAG: hypothetical protein ACRDSL_27490, partial [Pseudonocardiaceae bacterium]
MQRDSERGRMTADGKRTDDGAKCTLLVVHEVGGCWVCIRMAGGSSGCGYRRVKRSGWPGRSWTVPRERVAPRRVRSRSTREGAALWPVGAT